MKNLESLAQEVWKASSLSEKKQILLSMVSSFDHKEKQEKFMRVVEALSNNSKADFLASQLALNNTDAVIK
jgi:hypothetical protein|tara:strand:- start:25 stop:237 length:213 start_codon:yes stop_codon:yes gene_type:complete